MARPRPCVLFAQSFLHPVLAEYVDEVRFTEPVVVCACEFLELHTTSICPTLSLSGASFPQSFALEIFVRIGGEARFKRLCPAFLYSPSASNILEVQAAVTDHLIIRGSYRALSLVVYGNSIKELGQFNFDHEIDNTLSDAIVPAEAVFQPEDLPEALQDEVGHQIKVFPPLRNLQLVAADVEQAEAIHQLLSLAVQLVRFDSNSSATIRKVFEMVLSAASSVLSEHGIESVFPPMPVSAKAQNQNQRNARNTILKARDQIQVVYSQWQDNFISANVFSPLLDVSELLEGIFEWIQKGFHLSTDTQLIVSMEEFLIAGLAAVQLVCTDARLCFQLVVSGGLDLLMSVLQYVSAESSAIALLILGGLKCACQHAVACEALLGWWPTNLSLIESKHTLSFGYCSVLRTLLQTKRHNVSQLACQVLHHVHAYRLASEFEFEVEALLANASVGREPLLPSEHLLKKLSFYLKGLAESLEAQELSQDWSPALSARQFIVDGDDSAFSLPPNEIFSWISASKFSLTSKDVNTHLLLVLQERSFLPALAALLSAPWMRAVAARMSDSFLDFIASVEGIIFLLINSRSGLLFLASDQEEAAALVTALMGREDFGKRDFMDIRNANSWLSSGFICQPQDVGRMLLTHLSVISVLDRLLGTTRHSESFLWLLWELSVFSRSETGKQALSCITYFPEVFVLLLEALQLDSHSLTTDIREIRALNRAFIHSAAEVMQVILTDPVASSLAAWVPHALSLQKALQYCSPTTIDMAVGSQGLGSNSKDALCARLLDWVDAAVIFHKKGPVGLLRYIAALVVGSVTSAAVGGLPSSDPVEMDNTFGESAVSTELPSVSTLLGRGVTLGAAGTVLPDTAVIQLTVAMRIMASISCHPGVAAVLFGEGAMSVLYILLEYGASVVQSSTIDYDYMVEEDGEGDGITEMIMEQEREQSLYGLLLPTLLLLLNLLKRLQLTHEEYRNTRLVEVLLQLHRCTCSRLASKISVIPQATGVLLCSSVLRVIASSLAYWPVSGWMPSFFVKLLTFNMPNLVQTSNMFPLEPREAVSVLWILGDILPEEVPQLYTNKILAMNVSESLAVATLLGVKSMKSVNWHCQPPENEKLIQSMALHLDHISSIVSHLASTASMLLQGLLTKLIVRMACQNQEYAASLLRPVLSLFKEYMVSGTVTADSDQFRMKQLLKLLRELARHPDSKKVMVREGIVQVLLQAGKDKIQSMALETRPLVFAGNVASLHLPCLILDILAAICNPDISSSPKSPLNVRLAKDCPDFSEYCAIAAWAYSFVLSLPLEKELNVALQSLAKLVSHQLGRAAFATISMSLRKSLSLSQHETAPADPVIINTSEVNHQITGAGSLVPLCKRVLVGLSESADIVLTLDILQHFILAVIRLSAAGRSACGVGALHLLFEMDKTETKEILTSVNSLLRSWVDMDVNKEELLHKRRLASLKALKHVTTLLHLLDNLPEIIFLEKKVKRVVDGLHTIPTTTDETSAFDNCMTGWRLLPPLFFEVDETQTDWDPVTPETDDILDVTLKDKFTWECTSDVSADKLSTGISGKRKAANSLEGVNKKHGADAAANGSIADVASSVNGSLTGRSGALSSAATSSRRDTFRQRKPNTSRPPSMHVDDYVARERGNESSTGVSGSVSQRSALGGGRPPSIHVDEFMARQRDRHIVVGAPTNAESHPPLVPQAQIQVETAKLETSTISAKVSRPIMPEEDLQDVDIEVGVPETDDLLALPSGSDFVSDAEASATLSANVGKASMEVHLSPTSLTVSIEPGRQAVPQDSNTTAEEFRKSTPPQLGGQHLAMYGDSGEPNLTRSNPADTLPSTSLNLKVQLQQGMEMASTVGVSLQVQESGNTSFLTPVSLLGEQGSGFSKNTGGLNVVQPANQLQFNAAPPLPPPLPPPPPIPAGVIPEKLDVNSGGSKMAPPLPSSAPLLTVVAQPPPPPPRPSGSWQPADPSLGRIDQIHLTPINTLTFGMGPMGHQHNPQMGTAIGFAQASVPPWPPLVSEEPGSLGTGRVAPPLPPTPPPFSNSQAAVLQTPIVTNTIPSVPSPFQHFGRILSESASLYTSASTMESPSLERKFPTFSPQVPQAVPHPPPLVPTFQPPLPPGRPNVSQAATVSGVPIQQQYLPAATQQAMQPVPTFQFPVQTAAATTVQPHSFQQPMQQTPSQQLAHVAQQQEPGNLLQQILASPEAIQDLLKDQNKLQSLLEQHPKLISLLQEKMGQS